MKNVNKNKARTRTAPLKITMTEAEIMADLHYPVDPARIETRSVRPGAFDRNKQR